MEIQTIDQFEKNSIERVKVNLQVWRCMTFVDIRVWISPKGGAKDEEFATKKGITLSVDLIPELIDALYKVEEIIEEKRKR